MPRPLESYILHPDHCIKRPHFERYAYCVIFAAILLSAILAFTL